MSVRKALFIAPVVCAGILAGCAGDNTGVLSTGSVTTDQKLAKAPVVSSECLQLSSQIAALRQEGTPERIKKVASGKSPTANVKRSALAKLTELDTANAAFQQKCSSLANLRSPAVAAKAASAVTTSSQVTTVAKTAATANKATKTVSNVAAKADKAATAVTTATTAAATTTAGAQ